MLEGGQREGVNFRKRLISPDNFQISPCLWAWVSHAGGERQLVEVCVMRPPESHRYPLRCAASRHAVSPGGMTLLEMAVVIAVLLGLIGVLFVGARAWKKGSDRAACILNQSNVQKGVRAASNLGGFNPGQTVSGLEAQVIGPGRFIEQLPLCPGGGSYLTGGDRIPEHGELYMSCSLSATEGHEPAAETVAQW